MNEATRRAVDWGMRWAMGEDMIDEKARSRAYDWEPNEHTNPKDWYAPLPPEENLFLRGVIAGVLAEAVTIIICAGIIWAVWG